MRNLMLELQRWVGAVWLAAVVAVAVWKGADGVWWVLATAVGGILLGAVFARRAPSPQRHRRG